MTRQNVTDGPREVMTRRCPTCDGDGIVVSEGTTAVELERKLRGLVTPGSRAKAFRVELNARIASTVVGPGAARLRELEELTKRKFFLVGVEDVHLDHFRLLDRGDVERLQPQAPVEAGQELDLKLVEVGLHDPQAGVGKVKGFDVAVAGAARLVGKKVKARVGAVMEGIAYAELVGRQEIAGPITAEGEAEKPTRSRKGSADKPPAAGDGATRRKAPPEPDSDEEPAVDDEPETEEAAAETPAKKKTRRGSRGGRGRKKKAVSSAEPDGEAGEPSTEPESQLGPELELEPAAAENAPPAPVIHLPDRDLGEPSENGDEPAPTRKPTRRGSRGGRNRKKKTGATASLEGDAPPAEDSSSGNGSEGEWAYTPMSEWGGVEDE
jgi:ribonuclease G